MSSAARSPSPRAPSVRSSVRSTGPRPTLAQLRVFVAVARAGAFSEAATDLNMSQSTLSEGVAGLERALGVRLLERSPSGVALTATGERVLDHAVRAIQASDDLMLSALDDEALTGTLTVAAYRSLGVHLLPPALAAVHARFPLLEVKVLNAESDGQGGQQLILKRQADVGLMLDSDAPFLSYPLIQDDYVAVVPRREFGKDVDPAAFNWAELSRRALLLPPSSDPCFQRVFSHLQEHGIVPQTIMEFADDDVIFSMVAHGLGISIQPSLATIPLRSDLMTVPLPVRLTRSLVVATLPGRASLPHIRGFIEAVRASAAQLALSSGMAGQQVHVPGV
ncbi:LysR family transcriptional regulator [Deinococcus sp. KNUC1210]|uniref:LysR family transcriptional regulator n=1 Tax=Deinococcus sp. KNUC1210 TaxID=2917691 RepID=UPI001EF0391E|nr:LysR family transcriptional regulator [Deinococcus sp. KNUC1210]ULH15879.1 LysR family transcriptional regulator [Deinococcus sp. KNUC1210]